jgi:carboxyl-terminal processing protease
MHHARRRRKRLLFIGIPALCAALAAGALLANPCLERLSIFIVPPTPERYAALAVEQMRSGLLADADTYEAVAREVDKRVDGASRYSDTYPALQDAAVRLGGGHSAFLDPNAADGYFGSAGTADDEATVPTVSTDILPTHVGGDSAVNQRYIDAAVDGITAAAPATSVGWVLDLQDNHGGNVWPMLAAVAPLLSDGPVLSFEYENRSDPVTVAGASVSLGGHEQATSAYRGGKADVPIAVLINGMTGSSAEAVAISFVTQPNVQLFGQSSYGFSSVNEPRRLHDGAAINLTVAVDADRTGTRYGIPVVPDHVIDDTRSVRQAAAEWLVHQTQAGSTGTP